MSATATRNDLKLIAVVMRGPTSQKRFDDAKKLLDYGFANFSNKVIANKGTEVTKYEIEKSKQSEVSIVVAEDLNVLLNRNDEQNIQTEIILNENISAPLEYLEKVGVQKCYLNGEMVGEVDLLVNQKVESKDVWDFLIELIGVYYKFGR